MTEIEVHRGAMLQHTTDSWVDVVKDIGELAANIAHTEFVPATLRGRDGAKVAAAILTGRELGLPPMTALSSIHVINGKPGISAEMMRALVLQAGHSIVVSESGSQRVVIKGRRDGEEEWTTVTWTDADARRAGLRGGNYEKYPRQMLAARATTELCRLIFADVIHGLRSVEELEYLGPDEVEIVAAVEEAPVKRGRAAAKVQPVDEQPAAQPEGDDQPTAQTTTTTRTATGRRSPGLTRRGREAKAEPALEPQEPVTDGEQEPPPSDDEPPAAEPTEEGITEKQVQLLNMLVQRLGLDRDQKLAGCATIIGREISSTKELTKREASQIIDSLNETLEQQEQAVGVVEESEPLVAAPERLALGSKLGEFEVKTLEERAFTASILVGRQVADLKELTRSEAEGLTALLSTVDDAEALQALINEKAES